MDKGRLRPDGVENYDEWEQTTFRRKIYLTFLSEEILMKKSQTDPEGVENYDEW